MLTVVGIVLSILAIAASTIMDGNSFGALVGPSSFVLVAVGSIGATMAGFDVPDLTRVPKAVIKGFTAKPIDSNTVIDQLMQFADTARREGVLALEEKLAEVEDPFLKSGLQLMVDGMDTETVRTIMNADLDSMHARHKTMIDFLGGLGAYAPTMGMLGTVIGLINMLQNLSDPSQLGIGMSLALLTTLYGVLFANLVYLPIAAKLQRLHDNELEIRDLMMDGVMAIQGGASPRMLVERLEARLGPGARVGHQGRQEKAA